MGLQFPTGWNASFSSSALNSFANEPHCKNNPIAKIHYSFVLTVSILKGLNGDWSTLTKPERRSVTFTFPDWAFLLLLPAAVRALKAMRETACETEAMVAPLCHKCKKKTAAVRCLWRLVGGSVSDNTRRVESFIPLLTGRRAVQIHEGVLLYISLLLLILILTAVLHTMILNPDCDSTIPSGCLVICWWKVGEKKKKGLRAEL